MPRSSDSMYSFYFMLENIWHHHFTWSGPNSQEIVNFVPIVGPQGPKLNWNKFTISCEFDPLQVKWWYHMFSSIKMEEYMEPELSGIFWVKMVAKNIVLGFPGTHFMHRRVKEKTVEGKKQKILLLIIFVILFFEDNWTEKCEFCRIDFNKIRDFH